MTMKVKAIEKKLKFTKDPNDPGVYRYVMQPEQYLSLTHKRGCVTSNDTPSYCL